MFGIHRFVRDTMITMGWDPESVLARKKRFFFPHERPAANARREKQGTKKTDGRSRFSYENATGLFCQDGLARARKSKERGERIDLREKSAVQEKKNRRSVGKRNYRLMRRSFRHVGFERESAIGRCFFAEVIRVFARSLSSSLSSLFSLVHALAPILSSSPVPHEGLHDISSSQRLLESMLGHYL